jgi:hypothetical protein
MTMVLCTAEVTIGRHIIYPNLARTRLDCQGADDLPPHLGNDHATYASWGARSRGVPDVLLAEGRKPCNIARSSQSDTQCPLAIARACLWVLGSTRRRPPPSAEPKLTRSIPTSWNRSSPTANSCIPSMTAREQEGHARHHRPRCRPH